MTQYSLPITARSAFKDPGFLARPIGMGGAFTAVCDDANAVWYNPAGIALVPKHTFLMTYSKPYLDLSGVDMNMSFATYLFPTKNTGAFALTFAQFNTADLYQESTIMLSYAYDFKALSAGIGVKSLGRKVTTDIRSFDDPVFANGTEKSAVAADIGLFRAWGEQIFTGICVKNVNQPDVGFAAEDPVPMETRLGVATVFGMERPADDLIVSLDIASRNKDVNAYLGGEMWFNDYTLATRIGANKNEFSLGFSYIFNIGKVDPQGGAEYALETHYSFTLPLYVEGSSGSHRLSLGFQF